MKNVINNKILSMDDFNSNVVRTIKQYDDVTLNLIVYKDSLPYDLTNQTLSIGVLKPDGIQKNLSGTGYVYASGNQVTLSLDGDTITDVPGLLELELNISDSNGELTSPTFILDVKKKLISKNVDPIVDDTLILFLTSDNYQIISSDDYRIVPHQ